MFANNASGYSSDNYDEIVTGAGPGGGPLVRVVQRNANPLQEASLGAFYAYGKTFTGGVNVTTCNADGGADEIVTAPAVGAAPLIRTFGLDGSIKRKSFLAYDTSMKAGVHVACGGTMSRGYSI
jgi:hypothetical protein